jgi:hypothetical protein
MCADVIELDVRCIGCKDLIETPSLANKELFYRGVFVHDTQECIDQAAERLNNGEYNLR